MPGFHQMKSRAASHYRKWLKLPKGPNPNPDFVAGRFPEIDFMRFPLRLENVWCFTTEEHREQFRQVFGGAPTDPDQESM